MEKIFDIAKDSEQSWGTLATAIDGNFKEVETKVDVITKPDGISWKLEIDDIAIFEEYNTGYTQPCQGQYTKIAQSPYDFNVITVGPLKSSVAEKLDYAIFKMNAGRETGNGGRDCPSGYPKTDSLLIEKGSINIDTDFKKYNIEVSPTHVQQGEAIAVFFYGDNPMTILGSNPSTGIQNPDVNTCLFLVGNKDNPLDEYWNEGEVHSSFFAAAPVLRLVSPFVLKNTVEQEINDMIQKQVPEIVEKIISPNLQITIPDTVYAIVGVEMNLWNDAVSLPIDKGISSPLNYKCEWYSKVGLVTDRCFRFTPIESQKDQTYPVICKLYDMNYKLIIEKEFNIVVLPFEGLAESKNVVYFGDSLNSSGQVSSRIYEKFKSLGTPPKFVGTNGVSDGSKYESVGGYGFNDYATAGQPAYRVPVNGVTSLSVDARYTDTAGNVFVISEVNITEGDGNILLRRDYTTTTDLITPDGTLTKISGSGDERISYSGAYKVSANPLWNTEASQLDIDQYKERVGLSTSDKIDLVSFQFGVNDAYLADNPDVLDSYISDLYNLFIADNPNCIMLLGLGAMSGNTANGAGENYGSSWDIHQYLDRVYRLRLLYLSKYQNNPDYPNLKIACVGPQIDRYYGYELRERPISQQDENTEKYHVNYVHPTTSGYIQMSDAYFGIYLNYLK